jgi:hypothetical protein
LLGTLSPFLYREVQCYILRKNRDFRVPPLNTDVALLDGKQGNARNDKANAQVAVRRSSVFSHVQILVKLNYLQLRTLSRQL